MGIYLVAVTTLLLGISSLGIFGLATFNVSIRTKQIGTRRAVGARRRDILRYFMIENAMITTSGILVGCGLALGSDTGCRCSTSCRDWTSITWLEGFPCFGASASSPYGSRHERQPRYPHPWLPERCKG